MLKLERKSKCGVAPLKVCFPQRCEKELMRIQFFFFFKMRSQKHQLFAQLCLSAVCFADHLLPVHTAVFQAKEKEEITFESVYKQKKSKVTPSQVFMNALWMPAIYLQTDWEKTEKTFCRLTLYKPSWSFSQFSSHWDTVYLHWARWRAENFEAEEKEEEKEKAKDTLRRVSTVRTKKVPSKLLNCWCYVVFSFVVFCCC